MSDNDRLLASVALAQYQKCLCTTQVGGRWSHVCQRPATYVDEHERRYCDGHADSRMANENMVEFLEAKHIRWLERKATGG